MQPFFYALMFGVVGTQRYQKRMSCSPTIFLDADVAMIVLLGVRVSR